MPKPPHGGGPPHRHVPSSAIASFIDAAAISSILASWLPDEADRAFVIRCILDEGPAHHRGSNWVLLSLLGRILAELGSGEIREGESVAVPMRLPPHLSQPADGGERAFPLRMPTRAIAQLAPPDTVSFSAMVDCLTDGPPQHSLANAAMVCLLTAVLDRLASR